MPPPHRKTVRHFDIPNHAHELTFSTYRRLPILLTPAVPEVMLASIRQIAERGLARILAFVLMPEHLHLLLVPTLHDGSPTTITSILTAIKRPSSFRIKKLLESLAPDQLEALTIRERPGKAAFRFWQEGGGYDRNLTTPDALRAAIDYIHMNPVRRNLCNHPSDWPWSSWAQLHDAATDLPVWMPKVSREQL